MEGKHIDILRRHHELLVTDLEPKRLFAHLIQERVMTPDDQEGINKIATQTSQSAEFLRILSKRGPTAYQEFVKALEKNQTFLACILLRDELEVVEAKCKDLENRLKEKREEFLADETGDTEQESQFQKNQGALNRKSSIKQPPKRKTKYTKKTKNNLRGNSGTIAIKVATTGVTCKKNTQKQNKQEQRLSLYAAVEVESFPFTTQINLQNYSSHLRSEFNVELRHKAQGSLILTVHCRTLEILERLWKDYCLGHLDEVAGEFFLTDEITKTKEEKGEKTEDDADTVGLETTILTEDYLRCKKFLTDLSGLDSFTDEQNVTMENIKYKNILLKFYVLLLERLDPNKISLELLTAGVLTSDDKEKIEKKHSQREKNEELLMMIATKGPKAYEEFVKALEKDDCFLACQLLKEEKENLLYEVREGEWLLNETMNELWLEEEKATTAAKENKKLKVQLEEAKNSELRKKAISLVEIAGIIEGLESGWEELATALELGKANVRKIRKENKTDREKAYAVLTMWTDKEGEEATLERLEDTLKKIAERIPVEKMLESKEIVDYQGEVNRLLKKVEDEISIENLGKEASGERTEEAVLKELGIELPEGENEDDQKEVTKLMKEVSDGISLENRRKEGSKEISSKAASSHEEKKPKRKGREKKAMAC